MRDLIDRQAAINEMNEWIWDPAYQHDVVASLRDMPSALPAGHWIHQNGDLYECSECGAMEHIKTEWGYCPVCGAEMEGREK